MNNSFAIFMQWIHTPSAFRHNPAATLHQLLQQPCFKFCTNAALTFAPPCIDSCCSHASTHNRSASTLHQPCSICAIIFASTLHQPCNQLCINSASTLHQLCINSASLLHQLCITSASTWQSTLHQLYGPPLFLPSLSSSPLPPLPSLPSAPLPYASVPPPPSACCAPILALPSPHLPLLLQCQ